MEPSGQPEGPSPEGPSPEGPSPEGPSPEEPAQLPGERPVPAWVWFVVAGVIVCGVLAGRQILSSVFSSTSELSPDENAATVATVAYMDALLADDLPTAYGLTCTKIHEKMSLPEFERYQSDRNQISRYELVDVRLSSVDGKYDAVVETQMYMVDGRTFPQNVGVIKESAGWRVCE